MPTAKKDIVCQLVYSGDRASSWPGLPEEEVVYAAGCGNESACEYIVNKYRGLVYKNIRSYFLRGAEREDLIQEGMIGLLNAVRDYDPRKHSSFHFFADLCIRRQVLTAVKGANRRKHIPLNNSRSIDAPWGGSDEDNDLHECLAVADSADPESLLIGSEVVRLLKVNLKKSLSPLEYRVLLSYVGGKSYRQIAVEISRSEKAVDNALARIKSKASRIMAWIHQD
ncbi:MAG: sigma-70 family RNA polymerase sigma factor [bacterium]|nr:sigma-70 family RNA polymerase sigma factor [bacterium]